MKASARQQLELPSRNTGTTYHLWLPADAPLAGRGPKLPLMLVTDGDDQFEPALAAYEKLVAKGRITPLLVVGIGYGATYRSPRNKRMRDYTPTAMAGEQGTGAGKISAAPCAMRSSR